jgi:hypothetical protein
MKNKKEKKGLFKRLTENKKANKSSCCGNFIIEELPEENTDNPDDKNLKKTENK